MTTPLQRALGAIGDIELRPDEPMAGHTTYRTGGRAQLYIEVGDLAGLEKTLETLALTSTPWVVMGNGSNVLFSDAGFEGVVLHLGQGFDHLTVSRDALGPGAHRLEVGAAVSVTRLLRLTKDEEVSGVEFLGGIPGTVGGAIRMNAGTVMGEVGDSLESARVLVAGQGSRWIPAEDLGLSYRHSDLPPGGVVIAARFRTRDADGEMRERLAEVLRYRKATQPLQAPSCGSVFANPPGDHAGRLLEACGLKGKRVGGAEVSEVHANWIINTGEASSTDVEALIRLCVQEVERAHDITLRHEVRLLGDWPGGGAPCSTSSV